MNDEIYIMGLLKKYHKLFPTHLNNRYIIISKDKIYTIIDNEIIYKREYQDEQSLIFHLGYIILTINDIYKIIIDSSFEYFEIVLNVINKIKKSLSIQLSDSLIERSKNKNTLITTIDSKIKILKVNSNQATFQNDL